MAAEETAFEKMIREIKEKTRAPNKKPAE